MQPSIYNVYHEENSSPSYGGMLIIVCLQFGCIKVI